MSGAKKVHQIVEKDQCKRNKKDDPWFEDDTTFAELLESVRVSGPMSNPILRLLGLNSEEKPIMFSCTDPNKQTTTGLMANSSNKNTGIGIETDTEFQPKCQGLISEKKQAKLRSTDPIQQPTTRPTPNSSSKDTDSEIDTADHSTIMPLGSSPTQNSSPSVEVKNEDSVDGHDGRNINSRCEAEQRPKQIPNSSPSIEIKSRDRPQLSDDLDESKSKTELRPNHKLDCSSLKYKCEDIDDVDSRCFQCMDGQEMRELANVKTTFLDFSFLHQNASGNHSECLTILKKVYDYQYSSGEICYLDNMAKGYVGYLFHILECEQEELDCSTWESLGKAFGIQPETEMGEIMRQVWYVLSICASESGEAIIDREKVLKAVRAGNLPSKFKKWMYHGLPYGQITCPVTSELHSRGFKHITWDIKILDKLRGIGPDGKRFPDSETLATKKPFPIGFDPCDVCWNLGNKKCSRCKTRQYCSKFCQLDDWKTHKKICGREETQLN